MEDADIFHYYVDEMYDLAAGTIIKYPERVIFRFGDVSVTRKQIKHVIEHRKADGKSAEEIKQILSYALRTIFEFDFEIKNPTSKYAESILRVKAFKAWNRAIVLVLDKEKEGQRGLITIYPYRLLGAYFLLLKKLHTSAVGKTPHP